jgi:hypothetical protein
MSSCRAAVQHKLALKVQEEEKKRDRWTEENMASLEVSELKSSTIFAILKEESTSGQFYVKWGPQWS